MTMTYRETVNQSKAVFGQFGETKWKPYATANAALPRRSAWDLQNVGLGKHLLCVALGASLENNIDEIKKNRDKFDIITCDKGFRVLIEHGIKPNYVMICDCNIETKWIQGAWNETADVSLIATPYANPEWTIPWKGPRYFYVNKDAIETEKVFMPIFGENMRMIPASSNVSNAMLVFMVGVDEFNHDNFSGYEKFLLTGYDYSWRPDGNYYAFYNPKPKRYYMHHMTVLGVDGETAFTSSNLHFSARWLSEYINKLGVPAVNCSGRGLLQIGSRMSLKDACARINASRDTYVRVHQNYEDLVAANRIFQNYRNEFENSRRLLWQ